MTLEVIVLAAGKGTRMRSSLPKVLHNLGGRPLLQHVLQTALALEPSRIHVVSGYGSELVRECIGDSIDINWVIQKEQLGTGHALRQAISHVSPGALVLVLYGDVPLIQTDTLLTLINSCGSGNVAVLTAELENPTGYGRIVRDSSKRIIGVVEEGDASCVEKKINEINTGFIAGSGEGFDAWLSDLKNDNSQKEYYLTDVIGLAAKSENGVVGVKCEDNNQVVGVNSKCDLSKVERLFQNRQATLAMDAGLTLRDPKRFDLRGTIAFGQDCVCDVNVVLSGQISFGNNVYIGPNCSILNSEVGSNVEIRSNSVLDGVKVQDNCIIGPFARLRPGTVLESGSQVGNFVEVKNSKIGKDTKASHLTYLGDSDIGEHVNIGAGVITCNYDGANKHKTIIGDEAFIGSNSALVAPVNIGKLVTVGAGSTISKDIPESQLVLTRAEQKVRDNWKRPVKKKN